MIFGQGQSEGVAEFRFRLVISRKRASVHYASKQ